MAKSKASKKFMNMAYGLGASIVIIGALFKIIHFEIGPLTGNVMLTIGLVTEAIIFAISAFEPVDDDLDWSLVYPELANGQASGGKNDAKQAKEAEGLLSRKLDDLLKEANIDSELFTSLGDSIKNFEGAAKNLNPTVDSMAATKKYDEELSLAAAQTDFDFSIPEHSRLVEYLLDSSVLNHWYRYDFLGSQYTGLCDELRPH